MRNYGRTIVTTSHCQQEEGNISSEIEPNLNVGPSSMCPPNQNNVKRVNAITSLRSGRFIDHNLEDLVDVPIELSPSLSPPSLFDNDSASRDASDGNLIDPSPSRPTDLVNLKEIKRDRSKKGDDTSQPSIIERIHKLVAPFSNRLKNKKDQTHVDKIRETFSQVKINIPLLDAIQ